MPRRRDLIKAAAIPLVGFARPARAVSSPYNFSTMTSTSQVKIFGGNVTQAPITSTPFAPNTAYQYDDMFTNWASRWPNWVRPAILNHKRRGANHIRMLTGAGAVLSGTISQADYESHLLDVVTLCRSLGMTLSTCGYTVQNYSDLGVFTNAQLFAPIAGAINNVYVPNQDVIAYIEAGNQETSPNDAAQLAISVDLCSRAAGICSIPLLLSSFANSFGWVIGSAATLIGVHTYPQLTGYTSDFSHILNWLTTCMKNAGTGFKALLEEGGYNGVAVTASQQYFLNAWLKTGYGHPDVMGAILWGGQDTWPNGGPYATLTIPALPYDPASDWADTAASVTYASWGPPNRNIVWKFQLTTGTTINGTVADLPLTWETGDPNTPTEAAAVPYTAVNSTYPVTLTGTITIAGDPSSSYTISFAGEDETLTYHTIGTPLVIVGSVTNQAINITGTFPSATRWLLAVRVQRTAGSVDGTVTALTATMTFGAAPALNAPIATPQPGLL